ncbi:MAG: rhomboid family intramembrane serine protease [Flavobacteriales bacterium Tduv]
MKWRSLKSKFKGLNIAEKIATIHVLIYVLSLLLQNLIFLFLKGKFTLSVFSELLQRLSIKSQHYFALPASFSELLRQPWALLTYSFFHADISHLLFNSFFLIMTGRSFLNFFSQQVFLKFYFLGSLGAASAYLIGINVWGLASGYLYGSSAATMAVFFAMATYQPEKAFFFPFIGYISLKNIAIFIVIIDMLSLLDGANTGEWLSHLGGSSTGFLYMKLFEVGRDVLNPSYWKIKKRNKKRKFIASKILKKISHSAYKRLSNGKKELLFNADRKKRKDKPIKR